MRGLFILQWWTSLVLVVEGLSSLPANGQANPLDLQGGSRTAEVVPDPSAMLTLVPQAATTGPPSWAKVGTRLVYFGASGTVPGERTQLVLDPNGKWVNKVTGQGWGEQQISGAAGAGYTAFRIGCVNRDTVQIDARMYLIDPTTRKVGYSGEGGLVTHAGCAADLWIHPEVLRNVQPIHANGVRILRMPYTVNNRRYDAIRFQTETAAGCSAYVYDLASGLMIFHSSSAQGASVLTPPAAAGGLAGRGRGSTQLVTGWLMEVKEVALPWGAAAPPAWAGTFRELQYRGVQTTLVGGAGGVNRPVTFALSPKARGTGWVRTSGQLIIGSPAGLPPEQSLLESATGPGSIGGWWISPAGMTTLRAGQVIDQSDVTQSVVSISAIDQRLMTLTERGPLHRLDWTYDRATGMLMNVSVAQQMGLGQIVMRVGLTGQK